MLKITYCGYHQSIGRHAHLLASSQLQWMLSLEEYGVAGSILNTLLGMHVCSNNERIAILLFVLYFSITSI